MNGKKFHSEKQDKLFELPEGYLRGGYFDNKGNIFENYITKWAEDIAKTLGNAYPAMTKHQLRRFYNHVKSLEKKLDLTNDYQTINADLKMLVSYAANAACKRPATIPKFFETFIKRNLETVNDIKTFRGFVQHFQAVVGFCECWLKK